LGGLKSLVLKKKAEADLARPRNATTGSLKKRRIEPYQHKDKTRPNNPPVGLVTSETDRDGDKKKYQYDPHLDPQLVWAGKAEHRSFDVPTVSLHVHERIDPKTIIQAVKKKNGSGPQLSLFEMPEENPPLREALDFYKHPHGWSNRLIAGDSLMVMNSLLEKEGMAGQVQMVYFDPPYGIKYGSNFQPFVNKRDVKDGKDEDLTQEPEMIRAFKDTWELGIHSYLTYIRDRLLLARDLLSETGSCFVQISDQNLHHVREIMDEVFRSENFCGLITFVKATAQTSRLLSSAADYIVWYCRNKKKVKYRSLFLEKEAGMAGATNYTNIESPDGRSWRRLTSQERNDPRLIPADWKLFSLDNLMGTRPPNPTDLGPYEFEGKVYNSGRKKCWKTDKLGLDSLVKARRIMAVGDGIYYKRYLDDFPVFPMTTNWADTASSFMADKMYVVQTTPKVVQRCLLMTTDPGDIVFDPTCGSGTTAHVGEQWGRRWITCDTSRVAITLAKQRLMTAVYDYYHLAHPNEGVSSGFRYKTVPHVTLKSIANNEPPTQETLYDQPYEDNAKARVAGPFTVEAVPSPVVRSPEELDKTSEEGDASAARSGPTLRHAEWRDEILRSGVRGKGGKTLQFSRVEPLGGTRWLHADAETKGDKVERVVISFGPEHGPLEQRQVELAWEEARTLHPKPSILLFASFHFDPEASKDIDELTKEKTGMTFLKAQMNADLLTADLKKKTTGAQAFWLIGQPDVELRHVKKGEHKGKWQVEVRGFDYYNPVTGAIESGDTAKIAVWLLDTDYDGRSLYAKQVFFPMAGPEDGWARLARNLKAEIDQDLIEAYRGTESLPFDLGEFKRVAVKIVDDRGIESLRVIEAR
jgi:adenine-specific DNA-methyltransferase